MDIKEFFDENGYYVAKGVFNGQELEELTTDFDRIVDQLLASGEGINGSWQSEAADVVRTEKESVILHTHQVQFYSSAWARAFYNADFLSVATDILGPSVMLHHSKLFQKPAGTGAPFPLHQDWRYFPTKNDSMIAAVIHISESNDEMGCFRVVPGSHKLGRMLGSQGFEKLENVNEEIKKHNLEDALPMEAEPGDVVFFHYFTLHGSKQNTSDKIRKTILVQLHAGDDEIEEGNTHTNSRQMLAGFNPNATRKGAE